MKISTTEDTEDFQPTLLGPDANVSPVMLAAFDLKADVARFLVVVFGHRRDQDAVQIRADLSVFCLDVDGVPLPVWLLRPPTRLGVHGGDRLAFSREHAAKIVRPALDL